ncbi:hypothetical protein A2617_02560 [Candidatus Daviesbacteria bacterium RIFOXYD1_FULL_41_10]|uniref:Uncharacterized protein n=3 Tax=Patescibacteria group TaxID=1783273 RepID=A0A1F5N095_9BACT|nr:MAG: hypothetical protein UU67_C0013G0005 [Candidatus Daviesbacteria bacterium GW2011_GWB1_41_5]KKT81101.1 MAG: hypothetical protein UW78_C0017G0007 [Candidatus Azambacteria bacterium GW2011_GWA1_44_9]OGE71038.1 MAG: hypothetical protein A2617_02560 [Candidatus Daviesbacteria bacterium RIFOXYD1_FULL_41_10]
MNFVTTNIRLPEEEYLRLKSEAARERKSFAAVVREKLGTKDTPPKTQLTKILLNLVERAEKEKWGGPTDLATRHNDYFIKCIK